MSSGRGATKLPSFRSRRGVIVLSVTLALLSAMVLGAWLLSHDTERPVVGMTQTVQVDELQITMQIDDTTLGTRQIDVLIHDANDQPFPVTSVQLRFTMAEMDMGAIMVDAQPVDRGHFQAQDQFFTMARALDGGHHVDG